MNKKNKKAAAVFWILSVLCMGVIFLFSAFPAEESANQSLFILKLLIRIAEKFIDISNLKDIDAMFIIRKTAHCLEYTGLSFLLNWAYYFTRGKLSVIPAVLTASAYAVTDELHQSFVSGRSCEIRDWAIDSLGAVLGAIAFIIVLKFITEIIMKRKIAKNKQVN